MKKTIADKVKMYSLRFRYDILELDTPVFTGMAHGLNEDEAKQLFITRNPGVEIIDVKEIVLK